MIKNVILLFLLILGLNSCAQNKEIQVLLLGGQSNMAGHGNYDTIDASLKSRIEKVSNRVMLSTSNNHKISPKPLSYYTSESKKYDFNKHFGPEIFIGLTLAEANPDKTYLFIKKAVGGTSLYGAWNPEWAAEKSEIAERGSVRKKLKLFNEHFQNIDADLERLEQEGKPYKIIGMVWLQGESDTNKEITASNYEANLQGLITSYRNRLKQQDLPFVIGQVNPLPRKFKTGPKLVRDAMQNTADSDTNIEIVNTSTHPNWSDYPKHSDNLHYNTIGQMRLGIAFAEKLMTIKH